MTTFQEISTNKRANRSFWNAHIRFLIALVREYEKTSTEQSLALARSYRASIDKALTERANFEYFEV